MIQKKICMVGRVSVGKTSLVSRYVQSIFSDKYLSTVGVKVDKKDVSAHGVDMTLMIWDLAGDDDFQRLEMPYLRGASGYLLVADGTRRTTFDRALEIQMRVRLAMGELPFIMVVNKADLAAEWEVKDSDLAPLSGQGWIVRRTSAKNGSGVEEVFAELARAMLPGQKRH